MAHQQRQAGARKPSAQRSGDAVLTGPGDTGSRRHVVPRPPHTWAACTAHTHLGRVHSAHTPGEASGAGGRPGLRGRQLHGEAVPRTPSSSPWRKAAAVGLHPAPGLCEVTGPPAQTACGGSGQGAGVCPAPRDSGVSPSHLTCPSRFCEKGPGGLREQPSGGHRRGRQGRSAPPLCRPVLRVAGSLARPAVGLCV